MSLYDDKIDENHLQSYNQVVVGGEGMKALDYIKDALEAKGKTQKWLSGQMKQAPQNLNKKLLNNTISAQEFFDAAALLGYEIKMVESESNEELRGRKRGVGPRVRQMVGGVIYDTFKADALCHTLLTDGWFLELYRDENGRYFVAHYTEWESGINHISPCGSEDARRLYEQYGEDEPVDEIFRDAV